MKLSEFGVLDPILGTDYVILLRTSLGASGQSRALVSNLLDDIVALIGTDDIAWTALNKTGSDLADLATKSHTDLSDIGTNTHAQIDSALATVDGTKFVNLAPFPSDVEVEIADGTVAVTIPVILTGFDLTAVLVSCSTLGVGTGATSVQVRRRRAGANANMLSTMVTLSSAEYYVADGVIDTDNDDISTGDQIFVDVKGITDTTAPKGLSVVLTFS